MRVAMARLSGSFACAHKEGGLISSDISDTLRLVDLHLPMNGLHVNGRHWVQQHVEQATIR